MRRLPRTIITLLGILGLAGALAGDALAGPATVGGRLGLAVSRIEVDGWGWSDGEAGLVVGGFVGVGLGGGVTLEPGLQYIRRGGSFGRQPSHPDGSLAEVEGASYELDALELPVLVSLQVARVGQTRWHVLAGPVWQIALASEWSFDGLQRGTWSEGMILAGTLGAGVTAPLPGRLALRAEVLYQRSFTGVGSRESYLEHGAVDGVTVQVGVEY